jgi:hypothetical protein
MVVLSAVRRQGKPSPPTQESLEKAYMCSLDSEQQQPMGFKKISTWSAMSTLGVFRYTFLALCVSITTCLTRIQMFYFGYLGGTFIAGRTLQRFHAGKDIAICFFLWGCTLLGCSAAKNYGTLISLRFLLG